jgi:glyoxylase-like metal-dependent hydrolase (beta-lactamase superfamily II)
MEQIERGIFVENNYSGVTLGALAISHSTILIDAPPCPEDARSWRAALRNLGSGVNRLLINLDDHYDRTLGVRTLDCAVMAHLDTAKIFQERSMVFKGQSLNSGADWENCIGLSGIRWVPPSITFSKRAHLYWEEQPLILEHHPGPARGSIWVIIPDEKVVFVGDMVMVDQPPFLADADVNAWIEGLDVLLSGRFRNYIVISGRGGAIPVETIRAQRRYLKYILKRLDGLAEREVPADATVSLIPAMLSRLDYPPERQYQYQQRLTYGLYQYYLRHFVPGEVQEEN